MKKTVLLLWVTFLTACLSFTCQAQVENLLHFFPGREIIKQKKITLQIVGPDSNAINISQNTAYVLLIEDYGMIPTSPNKAKRNRDENQKIVIVVPYSVNKISEQNYLPDLHITFNFDEQPSLKYNFQFVSNHNHYNCYNCYEKGIFGEIEYGTNDFIEYDADPTDYDYFELTIDMNDRQPNRFFYAEAYSGVDKRIFNQIKKLTLHMKSAKDGLNPQQRNALIQIRNYCEQLEKLDTKACSRELFSILEAMRTLRINHNLDMETNRQFSTLTIEKERRIANLLDSCAQNGNPEAMLWAARINTVCDNESSYGTDFAGTMYYLTLALQGNPDAAKELEILASKKFNTAHWSSYISDLRAKKELGLISNDTYEMQVQYIKAHFLNFLK